MALGRPKLLPKRPGVVYGRPRKFPVHVDQRRKLKIIVMRLMKISMDVDDFDAKFVIIEAASMIFNRVVSPSQATPVAPPKE